MTYAYAYANNNRVMSIYSDDKELFKKCRGIWNRITNLIGIKNTEDFVGTTLDSNADKFIMADVHENTTFAEGKYRNELVIVLRSVINNYPQTSLIQVKKHKYI